MTNTTSDDDRPHRLYFKTYLQLIHNSVGTNMFRNFYVESKGKGILDALDDGENSCAFYVSAVLAMFKKLGGVHGTVAHTLDDLRKSGWYEAGNPEAGDVLVWEAQQFDDGMQEHIGFSIGNGRAISTSSTTRTVIEHDEHFGDAERKIIRTLRQPDWEGMMGGAND